MRNYILMVAVCTAAAALSAVGCSDDAASGNNGTLADTGGAGSDGGIGIDGGDYRLDSGAPQDASGPEDSGGGGVDDAGNGSDAGNAGDGGVDGAPDASDAGMEPDVSEVDCAYPSSDPACPTGDYGPASFLDMIRIVPHQGCCRDFDDDGETDNQIGSLLALAASTGNDVNAQIALAIASGRIAYLLEFAHWGNPTFDPSLDARFLLGSADGAGGYLIKPASFDAAGDPVFAFASARVDQGVLGAAGGTLLLEFPGLLPEVEIQLTDLRIESADVVVPADLTAAGEVTLENGKMSAIMERDKLFESLNDASNACPCLQKDAFGWNASTSKWDCKLTSDDETACGNDPTASTGCQELSSSQLCGTLSFLSGGVDINAATPKDPAAPKDAFSVGIEFHGTGASISGDLP